MHIDKHIETHTYTTIHTQTDTLTYTYRINVNTHLQRYSQKTDTYTRYIGTPTIPPTTHTYTFIYILFWKHANTQKYTYLQTHRNILKYTYQSTYPHLKKHICRYTKITKHFVFKEFKINIFIYI